MRISDWSSDVCSSDLIAPSGSSTLDWQRIADWTDGIAAGDIDEIVRVFTGEGLSAPVVCWSPREAELPVEPLRLLLARSEEHTSELQSLMRISYAVFCLKKQK